MKQICLLLIFLIPINLLGRKPICSSIFNILPDDIQARIKEETDSSLSGLSTCDYDVFRQRIETIAEDPFKIAMAIKMYRIEKEEGSARQKRMNKLCVLLQRAMHPLVVEQRRDDILQLKETDINQYVKRCALSLTPKNQLILLLQRISFSSKDLADLKQVKPVYNLIESVE